jgi:SRSO17 transposase
MPQSWIDDRARCRAAGVPDNVGFATKPQPARRLLERALASRVPCGGVTGDEVYGGDRPLRLWLESRAQPFVLAVKKSEPLWWQGPTYVPRQLHSTVLPVSRASAVWNSPESLIRVGKSRFSKAWRS